ncbi:hypothetical protein HPB47_021434 [Ixodes persulcatus]|uniref:Uncharacterized protein n=1 Tax=Ixodes persulcatus TaxID=34615 RepID=A0AC60QCJ5_IXOPE|nr:hypothetical protein HPB47_021434 [Ixodes persulcatus]
MVTARNADELYVAEERCGAAIPGLSQRAPPAGTTQQIQRSATPFNRKRGGKFLGHSSVFNEDLEHRDFASTLLRKCCRLATLRSVYTTRTPLSGWTVPIDRLRVLAIGTCQPSKVR